jgi:hypothetical protein
MKQQGFLVHPCQNVDAGSASVDLINFPQLLSHLHFVGLELQICPMIGVTFAKFSHDALLSGGNSTLALREHGPSSLPFEHFSSDLSAYSSERCQWLSIVRPTSKCFVALAQVHVEPHCYVAVPAVSP